MLCRNNRVYLARKKKKKNIFVCSLIINLWRDFYMPWRGMSEYEVQCRKRKKNIFLASFKVLSRKFFPCNIVTLNCFSLFLNWFYIPPFFFVIKKNQCSLAKQFSYNFRVTWDGVKGKAEAKTYNCTDKESEKNHLLF